MTENLDFSLPKHAQEKRPAHPKWPALLMIIVLIAVLADLCLSWKQMEKGSASGSSLSDSQQKQLALKLEKQGLNRASAQVWQKYLESATLEKEAAARIWYRIGKLLQEENDYDKALQSFYRSESFAKPDDIAPEIGRRIQECLEKMGKFAALRYELAERVGAGPVEDDNPDGSSDDPVVAEIGPQKILKSELDRKIEKMIETQISTLGAYLPEDQIHQRKEALLKNYSSDKQRMFILSQYIMEELLYRKARNEKLMEIPEVKTALMDMERSLLAGQMIQKELKDNIKITPGDLQTYYEAHKKEYVHPEQAKIQHILVDNENKAEDVRTRLKSGTTFSDAAETFSQDFLTRKTGGELIGWIKKDSNEIIEGMENAPDALRIIFMTNAGEVADENIKSEKGIHIIKVMTREPEREKSFEEVKQEVFRALRGSKEQELQGALFEKLRQEYDVVVHQSAFIPKENPAVDSTQTP